MATMSEKPAHVLGATLSRRQFVRQGAPSSWVSALLGRDLEGRHCQAGTIKNSLDPTLASSWIEIHPDNTVLIRTGKSDFGQGSTFTAYRQIVAEELSVPFEAITTVVSETPIARRTAAGHSISWAREGRISARRPPILTRLCSTWLRKN